MTERQIHPQRTQLSYKVKCVKCVGKFAMPWFFALQNTVILKCVDFVFFEMHTVKILKGMTNAEKYLHCSATNMRTLFLPRRKL